MPSKVAGKIQPCQDGCGRTIIQTDYNHKKFCDHCLQIRRSNSIRKYYQKNRDKCLAYNRKWALEHPDKIKEYSLERRKK